MDNLIVAKCPVLLTLVVGDEFLKFKHVSLVPLLFLLLDDVVSQQSRIILFVNNSTCVTGLWRVTLNLNISRGFRLFKYIFNDDEYDDVSTF